jgi:murein L,D-transpeptidase YcbB/YkuD
MFVSSLFALQQENSLCCKKEILYALSENRNIHNFEQLGDTYHKSGYKLLWDRTNLEQLLQASEDQILNYLSKPYHIALIKQLLAKQAVSSLTKKELAELDLLATDQFFLFSKDLYEGEIDQKRFQEILNVYEDKHLIWEPNSYKPNYLKDFKIALRTHMVYPLLQRYIPQEKEYKELVSAYLRYKKLKFPKIDYLKDLKRGDYGYEVSQLKKYLFVTGDLEESSSSYLAFPTFDEKLEKAVLHFQKRHYLKQNGIFDRVNALYAQKSVKEKLALIKLNIERYKLFPRIKNDTYVVINIPGFWLHFYQKNILIKDIFVVIGREDRPTPVFSDYLEYIVLNPTWSIPQNLMKKDYIGHLVENPKSLLEDDIHIYQGGKEIDPLKVNWEKYLNYEGKIPYQMVQKAGDKNVLGAMKFIFPNKYNVYLHDTNAKHLTTRRYRLYSSGCIRLSDPYMFLNLLAPYTAYSYEKLEKIIEKGKTTHIRLQKKIPIHIRYLTVFVDQDGFVNFRKDFYGFDKIQSALLRH